MARSTPAQHFPLANLSPPQVTTTPLLSSCQTARAQSYIDFKGGSSHCGSKASEGSSLASSCPRKQFVRRQVPVSNHLMWTPRSCGKRSKWFTSYSCWHSSSWGGEKKKSLSIYRKFAIHVQRQNYCQRRARLWLRKERLIWVPALHAQAPSSSSLLPVIPEP